MRYETGLIEDKDLAWEMAHAELPYRELQLLAIGHGLVEIAKQMNGHANSTSANVRKKYLAQVRRERHEEIWNEYNGRVCTEEDFRRLSKRGGGMAWASLVAKLQSEEAEQMPIRLVPIVEDEFAIVGDFATAAWGMRNVRMGQILGQFNTQLEEYQTQIKQP